MLKLMTITKKNLTQKQVEKLSEKCILCNKRHMYGCGTPRVKWNGCCVGVRTPKTHYSFYGKQASVPCFLGHLQKEGLIKFTKLGKEVFKNG